MIFKMACKNCFSKNPKKESADIVCADGIKRVYVRCPECGIAGFQGVAK